MDLGRVRQEHSELQNEKLDRSQELSLVHFRGFAEEKIFRMNMFNKGHFPHALAEHMQSDIMHQLWALRGQSFDSLKIDPSELLRKVPSFAEIPEEEFSAIARRIRVLPRVGNEKIILEGDPGDALYLIARGVVRVSRLEGDDVCDLATLMACGFFGEMAVLHGDRRAASVRTVTPCTLYVLRRTAFMAVIEKYSAVRGAVEQRDQKCRAEFNTEG